MKNFVGKYRRLQLEQSPKGIIPPSFRLATAMTRSKNQRHEYQKAIIGASGLISEDQFNALLTSEGIPTPKGSDGISTYINNWPELSTLYPYIEFNHAEYIESIGGIVRLLGLSPLAHAIQTKYFTGKKEGTRMLYISHDASLTGAPAVLLEIIKATNKLGWQSQCLIGGIHTDRLNQFSNETEILHLPNSPENHLVDLAKFVSTPPDIIYSNTVASAALLEACLLCIPSSSKPLIVSHIHELSSVQRLLRSETTYICESSDIIIAVSDSIVDSLKSFQSINNPFYLIVPAFIDCGQDETADLNSSKLHASEDIDQAPNQITTIFGCGTIEERKGFDLFCQTAAILKKSTNIDLNKVKFSWVGKSSGQSEPFALIQRFGVEDIVECLGQHDNPPSLYQNGDIFFMCSREDPFPLVCIEAASKGLPIVSFDDRAGGIAKFVREGSCGLVAEYLNCEDSSKCLEILINDAGIRTIQGSNGWNHAKNFHPKKIIPVIINVLEDGLFASKQKACSSIQVYNAIIVSFSPPPVNQNTIVEGGGLRCWGLANGIKIARSEWNVRLLFPSWYIKDPQATEKGYDINIGTHNPTGIEIDTWNDEHDLVDKCKTSDLVIMSFCHGTYSSLVASSLTDAQLLVFDCYVPIYPEVCARNSPESITEHRQYLQDLPSWNQMICRGDLLLCANEQQLSFYYGILFSQGKINPINYSHFNRLIVAPYGISESDNVYSFQSPMNSREISMSEPLRVLWFGGVYPWFNIEDLIKACVIVNTDYMPCRITIAGALNPFNNHPLFRSKAAQIANLCQTPEYCDIVELVEWVPYNQRSLLYDKADLVVALNQRGIENTFAWRTRIADYLEHNLTFATNGGDPLSDKLIEMKFGYKIDTSSIGALAKDLARVGRAVTSFNAEPLVDNDELMKIRNDLLWSNICSKLCHSIEKINAKRIHPTIRNKA